MHPKHATWLALLHALLVQACSESGPQQASCRQDADCATGELCRDGQCLQPCLVAADCESGFFCTYDGLCIPDTRDMDADGFTVDDCNDGNAEVNPEQNEIPYDGLDNDCDPSTLDDDRDEDGWLQEQDCDDDNAAVYPGAEELCDGLDNNCDDIVDDNPVDGDTWFADADGDGYGKSSVTLVACEQPSGYASQGNDCNNLRANVNPNHPEVPGDGVANDCEGSDAPLHAFGVVRPGQDLPGNLVTLERNSGEKRSTWAANAGLETLVDIAHAGDGKLYVSDANAGVFHWPRESSTPKPLLADAIPPACQNESPAYDGLFYDYERDILLAAQPTPGCVLAVELDPSAAPDNLVRDVRALNSDAKQGGIAHAIRVSAYPELIFVAFQDAKKLATLDVSQPDAPEWSDLAYFPEPVFRIVPAEDGRLFVATTSGRVYAVAPWNGRNEEVIVGLPALNGFCPDVAGDDFLFTDANQLTHALEFFDTGNYATTAVNTNVAGMYGCATNVLADMDGDGYISRSLGGLDCNDGDAEVSPAVQEDAGSDAQDRNCDGLDGMDADGDGNAAKPSGTDCSDDPNADPNAASTYFGNNGCGEPESCAEILDKFPRAASGLYQIYPAGSQITVYCEMGLAGGGWTLIVNRRVNPANTESDNCYTGNAEENLGHFFDAGCNSTPRTEPERTYFMQREERESVLASASEYLVAQFKDGGLDVDDAYRMSVPQGTDLFPQDAANSLTEIPVSEVCNLFGDTCRDNVKWRYAGNGDFGSSCAESYNSQDAGSDYGGEYGLCIGDGLVGAGLGGNRSGPDEVKTWARSTGDSSDYNERIFVR